MLESEIYQKIRTFIDESLLLAVPSFNIAKSKIIIANQSNARPIKPFITTQLSSFREIGSPIKKTLGTGLEEEVQEVYISRICTASIQAYSDNLQRSEDILNHVYKYLFTGLADDVFQGELALRKVLKTVTAIPTALNEQIESRAFFDIELGYVTSAKYTTGLIEIVQFTNQITNETFIIEKGVN